MNQKLILLTFAVLSAVATRAQTNFTVKLRKAGIVAEKAKKTELTIPVEIDVDNNEKPDTWDLSFDVSVQDDHTQGADAGNVSKVKLNRDKKKITIKKGEDGFVAFYLIVPEDLEISDKMNLEVTISWDKGGTPTKAVAKVSIIPAFALAYTLSDYLSDQELKLGNVGKVESANGALTLYGTKDGVLAKRTVSIESGNGYVISEKSNVFTSNHWRPFPLSVITVPIKVRPSVKTKDSTFPAAAVGGITNLGLNLDVFRWQTDRYYTMGRKVSQKFAIGACVTPSVEELDSVAAQGKIKKDAKSRQIFLSTGLTLSYSYNDISFVFVPAGFDWGLTPVGQNWIYQGKWWWGFGIAISPKIFAPIFNK